jgi:hypothetical protein
VLADDLEGLGELGEDDLLGLDPIGQLQAGVVHGDRRGRGRAVVGGQDGGQHGRADGVAPAGHLEGEFGGRVPGRWRCRRLAIAATAGAGYAVITGIAAV